MSAETRGVRHAFVVPAYGDSPHLRSCLESLACQSRASPIIISTSTPSPVMRAVAYDYGARLVVHGPNQGIGHDWNMALAAVDADWVTLAHQDDIYLPDFGDRTKDAIARSPDAVLVMTGYHELVGGRIRCMTPMLVVKRMLQEFAFLGRDSIDGSAKSRLLVFGCAIPCPSVTLRRDFGSMSFFREDLRVNLDWDAWWRLARQDGLFLRVREILVLHRIHAGSETTGGVRSGIRAAEDLAMFRQMWSRRVANMMARLYSLSYEQGRD